MIWHPILIAVVLGDIFSLLLAVIAAANAMRVVTRWDPLSAGREQIRLERSAESASIALRYGLAFFLIATCVLIAGITNVLPQVVPGAMCGTGVLQATDRAGGRALVCRGMALVFGFIWLTLEKLNAGRPEAPLTRLNSRMALLFLPFLILAVLNTVGAIWRLDTQRPVDCCTLVYDQIRHLSDLRAAAGIGDAFWMVAFWILSALLLICAGWSWRSSITDRRLPAEALAGITLLWVPTAAVTLVKIFAAYYYQVLHHHCPWCLFLAEHKFAGIPLFGALTVVVAEGMSACVTAIIAAKFPLLSQSATVRSRRAGLRLMIAALAFMGMLVLPAICWRLRYGVWLG